MAIPTDVQALQRPCQEFRQQVQRPAPLLQRLLTRTDARAIGDDAALQTHQVNLDYL